MRSAGGSGWTIDAASEQRYLVPWLERERDPFVRLAILDWIAQLGRAPIGRGIEERPGVFAARVHQTKTVVIWTLDHDTRMVVLVHIGSSE